MSEIALPGAVPEPHPHKRIRFLGFDPWLLILVIIMLVFGIIVMVNPAILNVIVAIALIIQGVVAIARHFGWF